MAPRLRAVLFDLDGTLIDSLPPLVRALNDVLCHHGRRPLSPEEVRGCMGSGLAGLVAAAFARTAPDPSPAPPPPDALRRLRSRYDVRGVEAVRPFDGVEALLDALQGRVRLALCTNKPTVPTAAVLARLGWSDRFDVVAALGDVPEPKPHPALARHALRALGVSASEALLVGDTANDAGAASAAGLRFVAVAWGYAQGPVEALEAEAVLQAPAELLDHLEAPPLSDPTRPLLPLPGR